MKTLEDAFKHTLKDVYYAENALTKALPKVAEAVSTQGGVEALQLRVAEQWIREFGNLAKAGNTLVIPANLSDVASMVALAMKVARKEDVLPTSPVPHAPVR